MRPVVACDHCGGRIVDALEGVFAWGNRWTGDGGMVFAHEKTCAGELEARLGRTTWELLATLPAYLGLNLGMRSRGAWRAAWRSVASRLDVPEPPPWER